jgi:CRISPR-associated exonuclease Cas4
MINTAVEVVALSALQHWLYCPRQCALIHLDQVFTENVFTLRGQAVHKTVDQPGLELRKGLRIERALPIWSDTWGLIGKADVVEFEPDGTPYPVEYKHGARRKEAHIALCDDVQVAAQALCLEEMTGRTVREGALFYATSKRRRIVVIDDTLRELVVSTIAAIRQMLADEKLPQGVNDARCRGCSFIETCQPAIERLAKPVTTALAARFIPD